MTTSQLEWTSQHVLQLGIEGFSVASHYCWTFTYGLVWASSASLYATERLKLSCFLQAMADAAHPACILETRKTAPGLRLVDKWAVLDHFFLHVLLILRFFHLAFYLFLRVLVT